jgi:hypothetical protein
MYLIRWNESDDHPKFLGGQNQRSGHSRNPRAHFLSSSLPSVTRRTATHRVTVGPVQEEEDSATTGPLAGACAHRWVDTPPSSGSSARPYPCSRSRIEERWCALIIDDLAAQARQHLSHDAPSSGGDHGEA